MPANTKEYRKEYYRKKYKEDEEFRKRLKNSIRKYQKSKKGKKMIKKANAKWRAKHPDFSKNYSKERRDRLNSQGLCIRCGKNPKTETRKTCQKCYEKYAKLKKKQPLPNSPSDT